MRQREVKERFPLDNRRWRGVDALILMSLAALVAIAFWEVVGGGRVFFFRDFSFFFYPKRFLVTQRLHNFDIPFWDQYGGCGEPVLGSYQVAMFYPLSLVYYLLPMPQSFMWYVVMHFFVSGAGVYYMMRSFGARRIAAGLAAVAWAFSPAFVSTVDNVSFMNSLAWLPWCLGFARKLSLEARLRVFIGLSVSFAMAVLAGGPEPVMLIAAIVVAYAVSFATVRTVRFGRRRAWTSPLLTLLALATGTALSGVEIVPFLHSLAYSARPAIDFKTAQMWSAAPSDALLWFLPKFLLNSDRGGIYWRSQYWLKTVYVGVMIPVLAAWTLLFIRRRRTMRLKAFVVVAFALFGVLMTLPLGRFMVERWGASHGAQATTGPPTAVGEALPGGAFGWRILAAAIGLSAGAALGYFLASTRRRNVFFMLLAMFGMFLAIGQKSVLWRFLWVYVAPFKLVRYQVKWYLAAAFALCVLAGFALDDAMVLARRRVRGRLAALFCLLVAPGVLFGAGWLVMRIWRDAVFRMITPRDIAESGSAAIEAAWERFFSASWSLGHSAAILAAGTLALAAAAFITRRRIVRPYGAVALALVLFIDLAMFGAHLNPVAGPEIYTDPPSHLAVAPHGPTANRLHSTSDLVDYIREARLVRLENLEGLLNYLQLVKGIRFTSEQELLRWLRRTSAPHFQTVAELDDWLRRVSSPQFVTAVEQVTLKETFHPNLNLLYQVPEADSFEPLVAKWHFDIINRIRENRVEPRRERFLPLLWGCSKVIDFVNRPPGFVYLPIRPTGARAILADHFVVAEDDVAARDRLLETDINATKRIILLESAAAEAEKLLGPAALDDPGTDATAPGTAKVVVDSGDAMTVKLDAARPALLFVADNWYPNWRARVDGKRTPIWRANYGYRAVPVAAGSHTVTFTYVPYEFYIGVAVTLATIAVLIIAARLLRKRRGQAHTAADSP